MTLHEMQEIRRNRAQRMSLEDEFYCRARRRRMTIERCLQDYVDANAFAVKRSACSGCHQGCGNRKAFAEGL